MDINIEKWQEVIWDITGDRSIIVGVTNERKKYNKFISLVYTPSDERFPYIVVVIHAPSFSAQDENGKWGTILHEIGHIETNKRIGNKRIPVSLEELYAHRFGLEWAIKNKKLKVAKEMFSIIDSWRLYQWNKESDSRIYRMAHNLAQKEGLIDDWRRQIKRLTN